MQSPVANKVLELRRRGRSIKSIASGLRMRQREVIRYLRAVDKIRCESTRQGR